MPPAPSKSGGAAECWSPAQTVAFVAMSASASPAAPRAFVASVRTAAAGALSQASDRIRAGLLVAFPTETVYGLGARVTSRAAVLSVFACKGRPASDPLIVHVLSAEQALAEVVRDDDARLCSLLRSLGDRFWPGPLTVVLPARDCIPSEVTAGTGLVGVRVPVHPVARALIEMVSHRPSCAHAMSCDPSAHAERLPHRGSKRQPLWPRQPHARGSRVARPWGS
jgi:tRNA threonylcarbamoyl adenosine modification protein (Sua5/YciO/YrdC/YwlC family)